MPEVRFRIVNVFAETAFGGNPLAVVEDASQLDAQTMQAIASQFNLSETAFLFESETASAALRIFTPAYELPFAGHPALGAAAVVRRVYQTGDTVTLQLPAGQIALQAQQDRWRLRAPVPLHRLCELDRRQIAEVLGLGPDQLAGEPVWMSVQGNEQLLVSVKDEVAIEGCQPDAGLMARRVRNVAGQSKVYVFARTEEGFLARFFWLKQGCVMEDPGTGSAAANLGGWWQLQCGRVPLKAQISQGRQTGRLNCLSLEVATDGGIYVGGRVVELGCGVLHL
ncbi:PhzF family phenazine biosynthesis protein [Parachitinimonas caeni]|uniref:PhzF family phenazine biosynthesis protein n=1 Tax=Parachitinimonas caeni TaxID=3031301 RepID=A0ABT7DRW0_9NEIS|nr:PhzF family phenazine biosynthesis protein [Parachitinimonas caeni]MDK2122805.1 PhzF family phenazine biosynthesis protein [Parachitinimonas caeni]